MTQYSYIEIVNVTEGLIRFIKTFMCSCLTNISIKIIDFKLFDSSKFNRLPHITIGLNLSSVDAVRSSRPAVCFAYLI